MRTIHLLFSILYALLLATRVRGHHSFRAVEARHLAELPDWPYAFLVSHVGFEDGQDWCITARQGTTDGSNAGFDLCDFVNVSSFAGT